MKAIRRMLVAVKNPDLRRQPAVDKAIDIARQLGASVELFHAIATPVFLELEPLTGHSVAEIKRESLALRRARLEKIADRARKLGVKTTSNVTWDFPVHEAIVRRAHQVHADLIVAECHEGRRLKPWLLHLTDWELLRLSARPVLLLKNADKWREPVIMAAVDPAHAHAKPARLDADIVTQAAALSRALNSNVEVVHANFPPAFGVVLADSMLDPDTLARTYEAQKASSKAAFERFADKARIPKTRRHLLDSDPLFAIPHTARKLGADLVVMGAVSRSGLKRVFIGNTAERVLDELPCDVLVVKPRGAKDRVKPAARGMRLVPHQPLLPLPV